MSEQKVACTRIELCFYVKLFLECKDYNKLETNEFSAATTVCDFMRKHIIAPAIEQATEFVAECKKKRLPENDQHYFLARRVLRLFRQIEGSVIQVNAGDDLVHVHMYIFTPMQRGIPLHNDESLVRYVQQFIVRVMQGIADNLAEENRVPAFREVYKTFADELEKIVEGNDNFARMHLINELR